MSSRITHHASRITHEVPRYRVSWKSGIEGYLYPKTMTQPVGSVRLMRKYNPTRATTTPFSPRAS